MDGVFTLNDKINSGETEVLTDVIYARNLAVNTAEFIKKVFESGNLAVVYAKTVEVLGGDVSKGLSRAGYFVREVVVDDTGRIEDMCAQIMRLPECVRFILAIGAGKTADAVRLAAKRRDVNYALVPTAPSTDGYIANSVMHVDGETIDCNYPSLVLVDEDILNSAPRETVAAGYGRVITQLVTVFDLEFSRYVGAIEYDSATLSALAKEVQQFEEAKDEPQFRLRLMKTLLNISRIKASLPVKNEAVDCIAYLTAENQPDHSEGEASFIASYAVLNMYRLVLSAEAIDTLLPSDIIKTLKLLDKMRAIHYNRYVSDLYMDNSVEYLKRGFVLNEYRRDLYMKLDGLDLSDIARFWRRLYDDAGFWIKEYVSSPRLMRYISLAAEMSENSLLKYVKRLGFLERFI